MPNIPSISSKSFIFHMAKNCFLIMCTPTIGGVTPILKHTCRQCNRLYTSRFDNNENTYSISNIICIVSLQKYGLMLTCFIRVRVLDMQLFHKQVSNSCLHPINFHATYYVINWHSNSLYFTSCNLHVVFL